MWKTEEALLTMLAGLLGFFGMILALRAVDIGFAIFGLGMAAFGLIYVVSTAARVIQRG